MREEYWRPLCGFLRSLDIQGGSDWIRTWSCFVSLSFFLLVSSISFTFYGVLSCLPCLSGPLPKARPVAVAAGPQLFHHLLLFSAWLHACLGGPPFSCCCGRGMMDDYVFIFFTDATRYTRRYYGTCDGLRICKRKKKKKHQGV